MAILASKEKEQTKNLPKESSKQTKPKETKQLKRQRTSAGASDPLVRRGHHRGRGLGGGGRWSRRRGGAGHGGRWTPRRLPRRRGFGEFEPRLGESYMRTNVVWNRRTEPMQRETEGGKNHWNKKPGRNKEISPSSEDWFVRFASADRRCREDPGDRHRRHRRRPAGGGRLRAGRVGSADGHGALAMSRGDF